MKKIFSLMILCSQFTYGAEVSITIDDFYIQDQPLLNIEERDTRILDVLKQYNIQAALFVTTGALDNPRRLKRLEKWSKAGHIIGNHTHTHRNYHKVTFLDYSREIIKAQNILSNFLGFQKLIRFPMLKRGENIQKRDQMRTFLKRNQYRQGYVTIDGSDWFIDSRLTKRLEKNIKANRVPYRDFFLDHVWDRSVYYNGLAKKHIGREPIHTLLLHHNLLNALFLEDVIKMYQKNGWKLRDAKDAFSDPVFIREPDVVPAGESILWSVAKEAGDTSLRYPAEDSRYEEKKADELDL